MQVERTDESEDVDVDQSDDEFEQYEWAGQTRVRASSLMLRDHCTPGLDLCHCALFNSSLIQVSLAELTCLAAP